MLDEEISGKSRTSESDNQGPIEIELSLKPAYEENDRGDILADQNELIDDSYQETPRAAESTKGRGRPRKIMTGLPGRPRKLYKQPKLLQEETEEFANLVEIPLHEALQRP